MLVNESLLVFIGRGLTETSVIYLSILMCNHLVLKQESLKSAFPKLPGPPLADTGCYATQHREQAMESDMNMRNTKKQIQTPFNWILATGVLGSLSVIGLGCAPLQTTASLSATKLRSSFQPQSSAATAVGPLQVSSFSPPARSGSLPVTVQVRFNKSLDPSTAGDKLNWVWSCTDGTVEVETPTDVKISSTNNSVAIITLPSVSNKISGTTLCTLSPTSGILSTDGDSLSSLPTVSYRYVSTAATSFVIKSFSPIPGTGTIPKQVDVFFGAALGSNAQDSSLWSWTCSNGTPAYSNPTSVTVDYKNTPMTATVALPVISGQVSNSTACTLNISNEIMDASGNLLVRTQSATYTAGSVIAPYAGYFVSPYTNATVNGKIQPSVSVFPIRGVTAPPDSVEFVLDNAVIGRVGYPGSSQSSFYGAQFNYASMDGSNTAAFDTSQISNGTHMLHVNALDKSGIQYLDIATPVSFTTANLDPFTASLCTINNGVSVLTSDGGTLVSICKITGARCPSGMIPYGDGNWTTTESVSCDGGSTTGCSSGRHKGRTGYHSVFSDIAPETDEQQTIIGCGPATRGSKKCTATITSIGCKAGY